MKREPIIYLVTYEKPRTVTIRVGDSFAPGVAGPVYAEFGSPRDIDSENSPAYAAFRRGVLQMGDKLYDCRTKQWLVGTVADLDGETPPPRLA